MAFDIRVTLSVTTKEFARGLDTAKKRVDDFARRVNSMASNLRRLGIDMFLFGTALRYTFGRELQRSIKVLMEVDDALKNVEAILNLNSSQVKRLDGLISHLGQTTKFFQRDIAEASVQLARAGWGFERIMKVLPTIAPLATSLRTDMLTASKLMVSGMEAFRNSLGKTLSEEELAIKVADLYAKATASARIEAQDLAAFMRLGASAVAGLNLNAKESIAIFGAINQVMGNGARAAYAFNQAVNYLVRLPIRESLKQEILPYLTQAGLTLDDINVKTQGVAKAIFNLNRALMGNYALASRIFGVRGLRAYNLLTKMQGRYEEIMKRLDKGAGVLEMNRKIMESLRNQWLLVLSALENMRKMIAKALEPDLRNLIKRLRELINGFIDWLKENKALFVMLVKFSVKLMALTVLLSTVPFLISMIMRVFLALRSVVFNTLKVGGKDLKLITRLIEGIGIGISGLTKRVVEFIRTSKRLSKITTFLTTIGKDTIEKWYEFLDILKDIKVVVASRDEIKILRKIIYELIKKGEKVGRKIYLPKIQFRFKNLDEIAKSFLTKWEKIGKVTGEIRKGIETFVEYLFRLKLYNIWKFIKDIGKLITNIFENTKRFFIETKQGFELFIRFLRKIKEFEVLRKGAIIAISLDELLGNIPKRSKKVFDFLIKIHNRILDIADITEGAGNFIKNISKNIWEFIKEIPKKIGEFIKEILNIIRNFIKNILKAIGSSFKKFPNLLLSIYNLIVKIISASWTGVGKTITFIIKNFNKVFEFINKILPVIAEISTSLLRDSGYILQFITKGLSGILRFLLMVFDFIMKIYKVGILSIVKVIKVGWGILKGVFNIVRGFLKSAAFWGMLVAVWRLITESIKSSKTRLEGFKKILQKIWFVIRPIIKAFELAQEIFVIVFTAIVGVFQGIIIGIKQALGYSGQFAITWKNIGDWLENAIKKVQKFSKHITLIARLATAVVLDLLNLSYDKSWKLFVDILKRIGKMILKFFGFIGKVVIDFLYYSSKLVVDFVGSTIALILKKINFYKYLNEFIQGIANVMKGLYVAFNKIGWEDTAQMMLNGANALERLTDTIEKKEKVITWKNILKQAKSNIKDFTSDTSIRFNSMWLSIKENSKKVADNFKKMVSEGKRSAKVYKLFTKTVEKEGKRLKLKVTVPQTEKERMEQMVKYAEVLKYETQRKLNTINRQLEIARQNYLKVLRKVAEAGGFEKAPAKLKEAYDEAKGKVEKLNDEIRNTNKLLNEQLNILLFKDIKEKIAKYEKSVSEITQQKQRWATVIEKIKNRLDLVNKKIEQLRERERRLQEMRRPRRLPREDEKRLKRLIRYRNRLLRLETKLKDRIIDSNYRIKRFNAEIERQQKLMSDQTPLKRIEEINKKIERLSKLKPIYDKTKELIAKRIKELEDQAETIRKAIGRKGAEKIAFYEQYIKPVRQSLEKLEADARVSGEKSGKAFADGLKEALKYGVDEALDYVRKNMVNLSEDLRKEAGKVLKRGEEKPVLKEKAILKEKPVLKRQEKAVIKTPVKEVAKEKDVYLEELRKKLAFVEDQIWNFFYLYVKYTNAGYTEQAKVFKNMALAYNKLKFKLIETIKEWENIKKNSYNINTLLIKSIDIIRQFISNLINKKLGSLGAFVSKISQKIPQNLQAINQTPKVPVENVELGNLGGILNEVSPSISNMEGNTTKQYNVNVNTKLDAEILGDTLRRRMALDDIGGGL